MKDFFKPVIILTIICLVAAVALAKVYDITKEPIAEQKRLAQLRAIKAVTAEYDNDPVKDAVEISLGKDAAGKEEKIKFYRCKKGSDLSGIAFKLRSKEGFGGIIDIMLGVNSKGIITGIEILEHYESPGLGAKIVRPNFKEQFKNKSLDNTNWKVKKDGGDIDQVTGATVSPRAVTKAVREGLEIFSKYKQEIL